jgi:hypothetical protein
MQGGGFACVKVPVKIRSKPEFRIPFRNNGGLSVSLAVELVTFEANPLDELVSVQPSSGVIVARPKSPFLVQFLVKRNWPLDLSSWACARLRRMMVLRVQGGRFCVTVPLELELVEGMTLD